ncbi:MAG: hypothetical protein D3903_20970 [Candidatus Electrothrix sp. GM3_4]|nr:hypothetical protein [Candidatus Electrothrix sp. GM3_4]
MFEHGREEKSTVTGCVRSILSYIIPIWKEGGRTALRLYGIGTSALIQGKQQVAPWLIALKDGSSAG